MGALSPTFMRLRHEQTFLHTNLSICGSAESLPLGIYMHARQCSHRRQTSRWASLDSSSRSSRCASASTVYEHASGHATPASTSWPDSEATVVEPAAGDAAAALEAHLAELETCMSGLTGLFSAEPPETVATDRATLDRLYRDAPASREPLTARKSRRQADPQMQQTAHALTRPAALPQAPDLHPVTSPTEAAPRSVITSDKNKLERALTSTTAPKVTQAGRRRARMGQWGKQNAEDHIAELASLETSVAGPSLDVMKSFMKRANSFKLLTGDEEKTLGRHIQQLTALKTMAVGLAEQLGREPTLDECAVAAEIRPEELRQRYVVGRHSKQQMMDCNLRLVVSISRKYAMRGVPLEDLVAEGVTGLSNGIDRFDPSRGFKLSTYVHWWIRQAVTRSVQEQSRVLRLPVHLHDLIGRIRRTELQLMNDLNRRATQTEVAKHVGISVSRLQLLNKAARQPTSTSQPLGKEGSDGATVEDGIEDPAESVDERIVQIRLEGDVDNVLHTLSPRECGVMRMRYGLDDGIEKTLDEIGLRYKVTRERIRQIECKALRKMKQPTRQSALKNYEQVMDHSDQTPLRAGPGRASTS